MYVRRKLLSGSGSFNKDLRLLYGPLPDFPFFRNVHLIMCFTYFKILSNTTSPSVPYSTLQSGSLSGSVVKICSTFLSLGILLTCSIPFRKPSRRFAIISPCYTFFFKLYPRVLSRLFSLIFYIQKSDTISNLELSIF